MKPYYIVSLLILSSFSSFGQTLFKTAIEKRDFYFCYKNQIDIAAKDLSSKCYFLEVNNGVIYRDTIWHSGATYVFEPAYVGRAKIYLKKKVSADNIQTIDSAECKVRRMNVIASFGGRQYGEISKELVCLNLPPKVDINEGGIDASYPVLGFTVTVFRKGAEVFTRKLRDEERAMIDKVTADFFNTLQNDDQLMISDITVRDCDSMPRKFGPIRLTVKDAPKYRRVPIGDTQIRVNPKTGQPDVIIGR